MDHGGAQGELSQGGVNGLEGRSGVQGSKTRRGAEGSTHQRGADNWVAQGGSEQHGGTTGRAEGLKGDGGGEAEEQVPLAVEEGEGG